jgi:hypothetical protein
VLRLWTAASQAPLGTFVYVLNEQVGTVLQLTNLDRVLRPFESVEAASDGW